ncbi:MAG: hypothetical protein ACQGVK_02120 [Myxococcota bacterium]
MTSRQRIHRRSFLKLGGTAGLAALASLRALPAAASGQADEPTSREAFFSSSQQVILLAIVERMVDTGDPRAPAVRDTGTLAVIDRTCAGLPADVTELLPTALWLFEWWPFLLELRFQRFSRLAPEEQDASLRGWMNSRFGFRRLAFFALRNLSLLGWWAQEETWPLIGYQGPLLRSEAAS